LAWELLYFVYMKIRDSDPIGHLTMDHKRSLSQGKLPQAVHELEKQMIKEAMARSGGNQRVASEILGITERMLGYRLKQYGLRSF
jgi:DNA-binding NtrC family response regulator